MLLILETEADSFLIHPAKFKYAGTDSFCDHKGSHYKRCKSHTAGHGKAWWHVHFWECLHAWSQKLSCTTTPLFELGRMGQEKGSLGHEGQQLVKTDETS